MKTHQQVITAFSLAGLTMLAGVGAMQYRRFLTYNVLGGIGWVMSMTFLGFFLARSIPDIEKKVHWVILVVIFLSILPILREWLHSRKKS
jgi:membrane-associated protein